MKGENSQFWLSDLSPGHYRDGACLITIIDEFGNESIPKKIPEILIVRNIVSSNFNVGGIKGDPLIEKISCEYDKDFPEYLTNISAKTKVAKANPK